MDSVPRIISTKDLDFIKDMLHWNLVASKKAFHYANEVQDTEVKTILMEAANIHARHYKLILNILE
jgi:hypothetical protein